jgi:predicted PurR-regulated permease PerM
VNFQRSRSEERHALIIHDASPVASLATLWSSAGQMAILGIFLLLLIGFLYLARSFMLPVFAAVLIGTTIAPVVKAAARRGIPSWATALVIVVLIATAFAIGVTLLAGPFREWIDRAPEIGATLKSKLYVFDRIFDAFRQLEDVLFVHDGAIKVAEGGNVVMPVVAALTPAASEFVLFFGTLIFYLIGQLQMRAHLISMLPTRDAKLRLLKIFNDIEHNLAGYLAVYTVINVCLGTAVTLGAWVIGLPNPLIFGVLAMLLNYVPYIGPAIVTVVLFVVGLVSFPTLGYALVAPLSFVVLTTVEGQFITPAIMGRRLTLNPLLIFLSLGFWTWMWGPLGAFLAVPLAIVALVTFNHLFPDDDATLPE